MLIVTAKIPRRKLLLLAVAGAAVLCCALLISARTPQTVNGLPASAVSPRGVKTNEDRIAYLAEHGWQVAPEPAAVEELIVPEEFDESYRDYLALQSDQGFDLAALSGKRIKRYTYEVTNYPGGHGSVQANLLIYKNTVVAGEVLSPQPNGFLHGLNAPEQEPHTP